MALNGGESAQAGIGASGGSRQMANSSASSVSVRRQGVMDDCPFV
jgi:hypothetical protein